MKENIKESLQFILQHNAIGSPLVQHAQNLARHVTLEHYSVEPQVTDEQIDAVSIAMCKAFQLGQTYWQQADSESYRQQAKSDITQATFDTLVETTRALLSAPPAAETPISTASAIHYPDCWDTAAYPTLASAIKEIGAFKCSTDECPSAQPQEAKPVAADLQETKRSMEQLISRLGPHTSSSMTAGDVLFIVNRALAIGPQEQAPADKDAAHVQDGRKALAELREAVELCGLALNQGEGFDEAWQVVQDKEKAAYQWLLADVPRVPARQRAIAAKSKEST